MHAIEKQGCRKVIFLIEMHEDYCKLITMQLYKFTVCKVRYMSKPCISMCSPWPGMHKHKLSPKANSHVMYFTPVFFLLHCMQEGSICT